MKRHDTAQLLSETKSAMRRLRDTFNTGTNCYGEYGRNTRDAYERHAATYELLTGHEAPSIYNPFFLD